MGKTPKEGVEDLASEVGKLSSKLPENMAHQVARDLSTLTSEATSEKPRKQWWELSINGLTDAAKSLAEIGKPVLDILSKIATILPAN